MSDMKDTFVSTKELQLHSNVMQESTIAIQMYHTPKEQLIRDTKIINNDGIIQEKEHINLGDVYSQGFVSVEDSSINSHRFNPSNLVNGKDDEEFCSKQDLRDRQIALEETGHSKSLKLESVTGKGLKIGFKAKKESSSNDEKAVRVLPVRIIENLRSIFKITIQKEKISSATKKNKKKRDWWGDETQTVTTFDSEDVKNENLHPPKKIDSRIEEYELKRTGMSDIEPEYNHKDTAVYNRLIKESSNDEAIWYEDSSATEMENNKIQKGNGQYRDSEVEDDDFESQDEDYKDTDINLSVVDEDLQSIPSTYEPNLEEELNVKFTSTLNFDAILRTKNSNQTLLDKSENQFLRIRHLRKEYEVHYIEKNDEDLAKAQELLTKQKCMSLHIEQIKRKATYLAIALKRRTFVFSLLNLSKNKMFVQFIRDILENSKILKVVLNATMVINPLLRSLSIAGLDIQNVVNLQSDLYLTNTPEKMNLSNLTFRTYGKRIDSMFTEWVACADFLGPDDVHYMGVNALAIFCLFFKFANCLKSEIDFFTNISQQKKAFTSPNFLLDMMCSNSAKMLKDNRIKFDEVTDDMDYGQIVKMCKQKNMILVTSDKFLIQKSEIDKVIVYRGRKDLRSRLGKFLKLVD